MTRKFTLLFWLVIIAISAKTQAQAPVFTSNFYNPCGNDGNNEFLVGQASAITAFDPIKLSYFVSGANPNGSGRDSIYQDAFCGSILATGSGSNACNAIGWTKSLGVGSGSHRILNYTNATDKLKIDSVVARLNYRLASCPSGICSNTFVAPDPVTGEIPAGGKFIFCISQGINDTSVGSSSAVNFCGFCNEGPFYVIVGSFPPGTSGLVTNTYTATTTRYISLAYDFGGATGLAEIHSYIHTPASTQTTGRNYFQILPQGANSLNNTLAQNGSTADCNITAGVALPVELTGFTGKYMNNGTIQLNWQTASEKAADRFDVERSPDATNFATIGSVKAKGNSSLMSDYIYNDLNPLSGKGYYRLKQVDIDGKYVYSETISVTTAESGRTVTIFPNPATDHINIEIYAQAYTTASMSLTNASGVRIRTNNKALQEGINKTSLSLKELSAGIYYLSITTDRTVSNHIIVKQ